MLTTYKSFAQTYGYFEVRADMPESKGAWPAFWLLPADGSWPPELDVIEMIGQDPKKLIQTAHSASTGTHTVVDASRFAADTAGFHTYGVLWTPEKLIWYFDQVEVASAATPADMHKPMYMLVNLAIGDIAGSPSDGLSTAVDMKIDYIHAFQFNDLLV